MFRQHGHVCYPCPQTCGTDKPEECKIVKASKESPFNTGESCTLPNGHTLYWNDNKVGGRTYISDEIGGGVVIWDTCLADEDTLLAAMAIEKVILEKDKLKKLKSKFQTFLEQQKDIPPEYTKIINEKFWDLI